MTKQYWNSGYNLPASCRSASMASRVTLGPEGRLYQCNVRTRQGVKLYPPFSSIPHRRCEVWSHLLTWQTVGGHASFASQVRGRDAAERCHCRGTFNTAPPHPLNFAKVRAEPWQRGGVPVGLRPLARRRLPQTPDRGNARDLEGSAIHGSKRVEWGVSP